MTIHLVRHGQTDWNLNGRLQGWTDIPLNATGRTQAQTAAANLRDFKIGAVISSDLARAVQTAAPIAAAFGLEPQTHPALRERNFGDAEGLTDAELEERMGGHHSEQWDDPDFGFPGGESRRQAYVRISTYLAELLAAPPAPEFALVSHGGALRIAHGYLTGVPVEHLQPFDIGNAAVVTLTVNQPS